MEEELADEGGSGSVDTTYVEEVPAREPKLDARPLKSALKKKNSTSNLKGGSSASSSPVTTPTTGGSRWVPYWS